MDRATISYLCKQCVSLNVMIFSEIYTRDVYMPLIYTIRKSLGDHPNSTWYFWISSGFIWLHLCTPGFISLNLATSSKGLTAVGIETIPFLTIPFFGRLNKEMPKIGRWNCTTNRLCWDWRKQNKAGPNKA